MSLVIRPVEARDHDAVLRVVEHAFGDHGATVARLWADVLRLGHDRAGIVAVDGDTVVGHVGISHSWLDTRRALVDVLVLSPLSVEHDRQRAGIGTTLVTAAIEAGRDLGAPILFLEGSPAYYGARGFEPAARHGLLPATDRVPGPACQVVLYDGHEDWMTGRLVYRDVWWEHDCAGLRDPDLAAVEGALGQNPPDPGPGSAKPLPPGEPGG